MQENLEYPNRMAEYFSGKTVFVTGATGFVGKVFVEKILRTCPDVKKIYVMARSKKGQTAEERFDAILNSVLYDLIRQENRDVFTKVEVIPGEISAPDLDISDKHRQKLSEEVQVIYHCAANVRFDQSLSTTVMINVRGTKLILELAKQCKNLEAFVHLSTAYCFSNERILHEKAYPPPCNPHMIIKACETFDELTLNAITAKLLGASPNTYAFTKALSENLVTSEFENLPAMILRPSVVIPVWKDPLPGWTDNLNGPVGLMIGAGKGVIRTMYCSGKTYSDYMPVDVLANAMTIAPFFFKSLENRILNLASSSEVAFTFQEIVDIGKKAADKLPYNWPLWYRGGSIKNNKIIHWIDFYSFQVLPALLLDTLIFIFGYKPLLLRIQRRILKGYDMLEYYANNQWDFKNDHARAQREKMNPLERKIYKLDSEGVDLPEYMLNCVITTRRNLLNEQDETIPTAKKVQKMMWFFDRFFKLLFVVWIVNFIYKKFI